MSVGRPLVLPLRRLLLSLLLGAIVFSGFLPLRGLAVPSLVGVTPAEGASFFAGLGLSEDGSTVVGSRPRYDSTIGAIDERAFLWTREDGYRLVDAVEPGAPSSILFRARDVSGDGVRIVGTLAGTPVVWTRGDATTPLPVPPAGTDGADPYGISAEGRYVVGDAHDGGFYEIVQIAPDGSIVIVQVPRRVPVLWDRDDGSVVALSTMRGTALGVSDAGVAVGRVDVDYPNLDDLTASFRWDATRGQQLIPTPDPAASIPFAMGAASAISSDGSRLVGMAVAPPPAGSTYPARLVERAYFWEGPPGDAAHLPSEGLTLIDTPPVTTSFPSNSEAIGVSADGATVVGAYYRQGDAYGVTRAFLWTQAGGFQDLEALLQLLGVSTDGWVLSRAINVSADGLTILGVGRYRGTSGPRSDVAWIAVVPEPSTTLLLCAGLALLAFLATRRSARSRIAASR